MPITSLPVFDSISLPAYALIILAVLLLLELDQIIGYIVIERRQRKEEESRKIVERVQGVYRDCWIRRF